MYADLKNKLQGSKAEVLVPADGAVYEESIKRWSEHCVKQAVCSISFSTLPIYHHSRQPIEKVVQLTHVPQACVVKVTDANDVTKTLQFVRETKTPFVVRGGGHSTSGISSIEGGLVIDLSLMRGVTVDQEKKAIRAEGGTLWVSTKLSKT